MINPFNFGLVSNRGVICWGGLSKFIYIYIYTYINTFYIKEIYISYISIIYYNYFGNTLIELILYFWFFDFSNAKF